MRNVARVLQQVFVSDFFLSFQIPANGYAATIGFILKNRNARMNYKSYDREIVQRHKVMLIGLPTSMPQLKNPFDHDVKMAAVQDLHRALQAGSCRWIRMNQEQIAEHDKRMEMAEALGNRLGTQRAQRSDTGRKRKTYRGRPTRGENTQHKSEVDSEDESGGEGDSNGEEQLQKRVKITERQRGKGSKKRSHQQKNTTGKRARIVKQLPPQPKSREFIEDDEDEDKDQ